MIMKRYLFVLPVFTKNMEMADSHRFVEVLKDPELRKIVMEAALTERDPEHETEEVMTVCVILKNIELS